MLVSLVCMPQEKLYVAPFIRRLMPSGTEEEILEASENLRAYLNALYNIYLAQEAGSSAADSPEQEGHDRFTNKGAMPPQL